MKLIQIIFYLGLPLGKKTAAKSKKEDKPTSKKPQPKDKKDKNVDEDKGKTYI